MHIDHQALFRPLVKASYQIGGRSIGETVRRALALATAEPPGPVHLDLPEDVATSAVILRSHSDEESVPSGDRSFASLRMTPEADLERVMDLLRKAKKPVAALGFSLYRSGALPELRRFLEANHLPFVTTNMAKGAVPEDHPLWLGVVGRVRRKTIEDY